MLMKKIKNGKKAVEVNDGHHDCEDYLDKRNFMEEWDNF